ncbi:MAG: FecR family protein [Candidatus Pedobacter colombiensis]|uniref:FecR family protein n=1 Tax=Candidatus Pedobacter colombiensis TaxID=3121371 RepID=A0AAJ5W7K2_9SPHI|nr:FecR family protein [Pedobacter sp.]WEK18613.1 MAG: FecR family protein [Pedobacter sp.]
MDQIKLYTRQLVAEAMSLMQNGKVESLPMYDNEDFIGKITYEELQAFLKYNQKSGNINAHKLNFELGTALITIKRMRREAQQRPVRSTLGKQFIIGLSSVAAVALVLLGLTSLFFKPVPIVPSVESNVIVASSKNILLTLANGENIPLNEAKTGVAVKDHILTYIDGGKVAGQERLATNSQQLILNIPRGGMYQMVLPDGSKVWLNAASSLKFPSTFAGATQRRVELNGEAYFEIAKVTRPLQQSNKQSAVRVPFIVVSNGQEIEVLGTHFNVSAYSNEKNVTTTLLEGSVCIRPSQNSMLSASLDPSTLDFMGGIKGKSGLGKAVMLKPNQEATLINDKISVKRVDAEEAIAWRNGEFTFRNAPLESIMRMVARWYDVEVVYQNKEVGTALIGGTMIRSNKIPQVLQMLELTANVHFKVEGRRITVIE